MHRNNFILILFFLTIFFLMMHVCSRNYDSALNMSISMIMLRYLLFYTFFLDFFWQYFVDFFFEGNILYTYLILKKCIAPILCLFFLHFFLRKYFVHLFNTKKNASHQFHSYHVAFFFLTIFLHLFNTFTNRIP